MRFAFPLAVFVLAAAGFSRSALAVGGTRAAQEQTGYTEDGGAAEDGVIDDRTQAEQLEGALSLAFQRGGTGRVGERATIEVPDGFVFADGPSTIELLEAMGNITGGNELGTLAVESFEWFVVFDFDESGYVKDDEKDELDADEMLATLQANAKAGNEERRRRGLEEHAIVGWVVPPQYNAETQNLEWAFTLRSPSGDSVNHNTRLLGRKGVMSATLVCGPQELERVLPEFRERLATFEYGSGERYSEYTAGDKVAALGLTALVAGGAGVIAAKTGFLAKFWKLIAAGVIAVGVALKKLFGFGKKQESSSPSS